MRCGLALFVLGLLVIVSSGALGLFLPPHWRPDLGLLLVVAVALSWRSSSGGVLLAAVFGFFADLLSGTLLGQHALLHLLAYAAARLGSSQLNLRGVLPQAAFVALLTVVHAGVVAASTAFFVPGVAFALPALGAVAAQALVNAVCAPLVTGGVGFVVGHLSPDDVTRRLLRLEPRSFGA